MHRPLAWLIPALLPTLFTACAGPVDAGRNSWHYRAEISSDLERIDVEARFPPAGDRRLVVPEGGESWVESVELADGDTWRAVPRADSAWQLPAATTAQRVRYRFRLLDWARDRRRLSAGPTVLTEPSAWLLHPGGRFGGFDVRLDVVLGEGLDFETGLARADEAAPPAYSFDSAEIEALTYTAVGQLRTHVAEIPGATLRVVFLPGEIGIGEEAVIAWVRRSADALRRFVGRLPVDDLLVLIVPRDSDRVDFASASGGGGAAVRVLLGRGTTVGQLDRDWVMVHELVHIAFPSLPHRWLEEGSATYVEPLARYAAGMITAEDVWNGFIDGLPEGLPAAGDRGLDRTPTWGRTYWGGALFCFLADVEIRRRTENRFGFRDVMRAVVDAGGEIDRVWRIERFIAVGDRRTGVPVLAELYAKMARDPHPVDLDDLFRRLGVRRKRGRVYFEDDAPEAGIRRGITPPR